MIAQTDSTALDPWLDVGLSREFTIRDYKAAKAASPPNRGAIARAIQHRFHVRYLDPIEERPNGFSMMAVSCLMIEALESFYQGWPSTSGRGMSKLAFENFFQRVDAFAPFRDYTTEFYRHVRCGILHQAESTGGWRVRRDGDLFVPPARTINAKAFSKALRGELDRFCFDLAGQPWDGPIWAKVLAKMDAIVENCRPTANDH